MEFSVTGKLIVAWLIGAAIGFERESYDAISTKDKEKHDLGLRTFSLLTPLGLLTGLLIPQYLPVAVLIGVMMLFILTAYYIIHSVTTKDIGITTELAVVYGFVIGILLAIPVVSIQLVLAITVILMLILSRKQAIKSLVSKVSRGELNAFIGYAIIALVILPFLPDKKIVISDIPGLSFILQSVVPSYKDIAGLELINPSRLWFLVALITGIDVGGYALEQLIGPKSGRALASFFGGFVSSTATTQGITLESVKNRNTRNLIALALISNVASFIQVSFVLAPLNLVFFQKALLFLVSLILSGTVLSGLLLFLPHAKKRKKEVALQTKKTEIFSLVPALKFAVIFLIVRLVSRIAYVYFGASGFFVTSIIASFTGIDAVVINIAELAGKTISMQTALIALALVNMSNLLSKAFFGFLQGRRPYAIGLLLNFIGIIIVSWLAVILSI